MFDNKKLFFAIVFVFLCFQKTFSIIFICFFMTILKNNYTNIKNKILYINIILKICLKILKIS